MHREWFTEQWRVDNGLVVELHKVELMYLFVYSNPKKHRRWNCGEFVEKVEIDYGRGVMRFYEEGAVVGQWSVGFVENGWMQLGETE